MASPNAHEFAARFSRTAGLKADPEFFVDFGDERPHQVRLQGGDSSSDSYCYPS